MSDSPYFDFQEIDALNPIYDAYLEFRYRVFCEELHRINHFAISSLHGRPVERDEFDSTSRHFIALHLATHTIAACCRLILPSPVGLNITGRYIVDQTLPADAAMGNIAEISRMCIAPSFRRRVEDKGMPVEGNPGSELTFQTEGQRQHQPALVLGIYREIYQACTTTGIHYCFAAMETRLYRLLNILGFPFVPVGPINPQVSPPRRVYLIGAEAIRSSLRARNEPVLNYLEQSTLDC